MKARDIWNENELAWWENDTMGHVWKTNKDGVSDRMAMSFGDHNGPKCSSCGYTFCEHCAQELKLCTNRQTN